MIIMKKEKINSIIDINILSSLVVELLKKLNLNNIKRVSKEIIYAEEKTSLKTRNTFFFVTLSELSGKIPTIKQLIESVELKNIDNAYIITSHKRLSNYFKDWIKAETKIANIEFWSRDELIEFIDENMPEYWGHDDIFLKIYEQKFLESLEKETELKKVLRLDEKFSKLLNIFIEPKIHIYKEDRETKHPIKSRIKIDHFLHDTNCIVSGDAGTGKSTLLKEVAKRLIQNNKDKDNKSIPIYIKSDDLSRNSFSIELTINNFLKEAYSEFDIDKIFQTYKIVLLIDSIDEFERETQLKLIEELNMLYKKHVLRFILCTRSYSNLTKGCEMCSHIDSSISNFDLRQVKEYLDNFFRFDLAKSDKLWGILLDHNTLEKIPVTPLTISLISILYEERGYEIPATITDVYDNFNLFLLGRINVSSKLDFLDINIKERILSIYALEIIKSPNRKKMSVDEFLHFVRSFFEGKTISINNELIPDLLNSLTDGTGILFIDSNNFISFKHDHFMEYYASIEIFNHYRSELEDTIIDKFTEFNWQNTAIFYTGRTKDMAKFLEKLIERTKKYSLLNECLIAISGLGYILQSLWMTDSHIRKNGVLEALRLLIKADGEVKKLSSSKFPFFGDIRDPDIAIMNLFWFFKHFNSITLKDSLILAFEDLHTMYKQSKDTVFLTDRYTMLYQLFCVAATLNSGRSSISDKLLVLFDENGILNIPLFVLLFDSGIEVLESENKQKLKHEYDLKNRVKKHIKGIKFYLENPSEDLRYTTLEMISSSKKVEIYTEGKTDASIIQHAFSVLYLTA